MTPCRTALRTAIVALALLLPGLAGCFGGEARTEWAFQVTQLSELAGQGRTGRGVVVAVLDTGINPDHVALQHLFDGDKANGEVVAFRDYTSSKTQAYDDDGHGSHVTGIIAASGSSLGDKLVYGGIDLLGGAPAVQLVIGKVCGPGSCVSDAIPDAVDWAVGQHAQVISLSLGGNQTLFSNTVADRLSSSINNALAKGVVVVAAAGNEGTSTGDVSAPADIPGVIAVGAIQSDGSVWERSSRGNDQAHPCVHVGPLQTGRCDPDKKPEILAPGVEILSAWKGDQYVRATGTSQATPFVTAAVALMLEGHGRLTNASQVEDLKQALVDNTKQVGNGYPHHHDNAAGYGLLQAKAAVDHYR